MSTFQRGDHVTAGTRTVHLVANVRPMDAPYRPGQPYPYCSATLGNSAVVTAAPVTCKTCAKHDNER